MGTSGTAKIPVANTFVVEDPETSVEIKIKTLDSQTYNLRVDKCVPIPALKEQIATITGVLSDQQRLICRGRVLKDDQLLSAYHVEDGHTLHLVVRQPYPSSAPFLVSEGLSVNPAANSAPDSNLNNPSQISRTIVLEAFNVDQTNIDSTPLNRIVENILNSFGASNNGSVNVSANIREAHSERLPRPFTDTAASSTRNQQNITSQGIESDRQREALRFPSAVSSGHQNLPEIPHSLTTLRQYLAHLNNEFRREMPVSNADIYRTVGEASTVHQNEGLDHVPLSHRSSRGDDLPSPAALAEILKLTRQLLAEHAEDCLLGLARELEHDTSAAAYPMRSNVQSNAIRTGFFLQNLGSLLLELGRTTMTLRMGQGPNEIVVNSGPAVFISASGPNPVMVQPVPFYPAPSFGGMHIGSTNSGHGPEGERVAFSVLPRNIDIRIHTVPIPADSQNRLGSTHIQQENINLARTSIDRDSVHQAAQSHPHNATLSGEYGFGVVPLRAVVAMPTGVSSSQSDLSGNLIPLLNPLFARIRQHNTGNVNVTLSPQAIPLHQGSVESNEELIPDSMRRILESYTGGSLQETQVQSYTLPVVSESSIPPTLEIDHHEANIYISSERITPSDYGESSHVNDGQHVGQGSLLQFLSTFNQPSNTLLVGEQIDTGGVNQQEPTDGSHSEQVSIDRDSVSNEPSRAVNDQGVLFSNFLRQLMPLLMQDTAVTQDISRVNPNPVILETHTVSSVDASSSQHLRDQPESPNPKRHKRE
ncbi:hypothetical protein KSP39_PZI012635 [Platanthera zijinensis]|uniref:Ubiquitin-like domain-containing protein n=1 Tax=Platanthera zijinensis TaxID=2320716 RepID=A0AAP0G4V1_9ASPA